MKVLCTILTLIAAATQAGTVAAQPVVTSRLALSGGSATDMSGRTSGAATLSAGAFVSASSNTVVGVSGAATRFDGQAWSASARSSLTSRYEFGNAAITMDGALAYATSSYDIANLVGEVIPGAELRAGGVTVFGAAHIAGATSWFPVSATGELPGFLRGPTEGSEGERDAISRDAVTLIYGVAYSKALSGRTRLNAGLREERGRVAGLMEVDRTVSAGMSAGVVSLQASAIFRTLDEQESRSGAAATSVQLSPVLTAEIAVGRHAENPLTGTMAGRYVSAGVSMQLGGGPRSLPKPLGAPELRRGMTRVSIAALDARTVELAGDFTNWSFRTARRAGNGVWYLDLELPPGQYRYAFRIDGTTWRIPDGAPAAKDDFGGKSAWLKVSDSHRLPGATNHNKEER